MRESCLEIYFRQHLDSSSMRLNLSSSTHSTSTGRPIGRPIMISFSLGRSRMHSTQADTGAQQVNAPHQEHT